MKKEFTLLAIFITTVVSAQNFQLHRDFTREHFTSTFTYFKGDKLGNTFTFMEFDYGAAHGIGLGYIELARVIKTQRMPVGLHLEYNGGLGTLGPEADLSGYTINDAWIVGVNYGKDYENWGFSTYAGYKAIKNAGKANFQFTGIWYFNIIKNKLTTEGFADLWTAKMNRVEDKTIFISEPQIWYHINSSFWVGGEVELSSNFGGVDGFKTYPTLAVRWNL
jgi:hypothetical protein